LLLGLSGLGMVIILIANILYWRYQYKVEVKIDENNITPSDFTLEVSNIARDITPEELLAYFRETYPMIEFLKVNFCYKIWTIVKLVRK